MMMDPAPSVNKAYSLVLAEESQKILVRLTLLVICLLQLVV